uniref:NAD(+)--protein-arginine ADP-ribosyltransferase n=1 Tax=Strombidium rassoulzadegani TaxID=1082188 RepID=A0A7S3FTP5_9SPIT|mmetsp:Transcript_11220/g.18890  ORF Transcript_11220/g.18890 Transcript_11220/m.18890 type:complete len:186 (+) Transcript_11220:763-1320(+)
MYTMESFLYREVNRASRERDVSKVETLGPYAWVLRKIVEVGQLLRKKSKWEDSQLILFRGLGIFREQLEDIIKAKEQQSFIILEGFQSSSLKKSVAEVFALQQRNKVNGRVPCVYLIEFFDSLFYFDMNSKVFSAFYTSEREILLMDGLQYQVINVKDLTAVEGYGYYYIHLRCSGNNNKLGVSE